MSHPMLLCLSRGQVVLSSCAEASPILIGKADPGVPEGTYLVWEKYEPGTCVLCKKECGKVVWKGLRRDRGKMRVRKMGVGGSRPLGVELSGPVKITFCKECLDRRNGRKYNVSRIDHAAAGPCCLKGAHGLVPCSVLLTPKNFELGYMSVRSLSEYTDNNISDELRRAYNCQQGRDQDLEIKIGKGRKAQYLKTDLGQYVAANWTSWSVSQSEPRAEIKCPPSLIDWVTTITQQSEAISQQRWEQEVKVRFQGRKMVLKAHVIKYTTDSGRTCSFTHNIFVKPGSEDKSSAAAAAVLLM